MYTSCRKADVYVYAVVRVQRVYFKTGEKDVQ